MSTLTLGPTGTYSHRATQAVVGDEDIEFVSSVTGIIEAVAVGDADKGVVPVENSIEGSVTEALDSLAGADVAVTREVVTPIRHALLAQRPSFETVASHSQALAQCRSYLESHYSDTTQEAVASTAQGVERAREDPTIAAIGHPANADESESGLSVLAADIQDRASNATRFLVVEPVAERSTAGSKTSVIVYPNQDYPGLLLSLLEPFAERDINLTRIESRPSGERLGDYVFHFDMAAGLYEDRAVDALETIESVANEGWVKRLGSYDTETVVE